jgi:hypothetical protein
MRFESAGINRFTCRPLYRVVTVSSVTGVSGVISSGRTEFAE